MPNPAGSPVWYELMTRDPGGAKRFYERVVGWSIGEPQDGNGYRMIGRNDGGFAGGLLPLTDEMCEGGAFPLWIGYIGVDDVDAILPRIVAKGGQVMMQPFDVPQAGRIAMVTDPQGNPFYVMKPSPPPGDEDKESDVFSPTAEQRVGWNELTTADPAAARDFYGELFNWTSDEFMPMGELGEYRFFAHHGTTVGAVCGVQPNGGKGWTYYIRVPSIREAIEDVKSGGGSVAMGPHEVPGGDQIIIGNDPDGAKFALVGKA